MRTLLVVGLVVGTLGVGACSSSSSSPPPYGDVTSFCTAVAKATCEPVALACAIDQTTCETAADTQCSLNAASILGVAGTTRVYTQPNAQACIDALNSAYGNLGNNPKVAASALIGNGSIADKCDRVFQGTAGNAAPCTENADCTNDLSCLTVGTSTTKLCAATTAVAANGFCDNPGDVCAAGTYCAGNPGMCVPAVQSGGSCTTGTVMCGSTQRCLDGLCQPLAKSGDTCNSNTDCDPSAAYCDAAIGGICTTGVDLGNRSPDCEAYESSSSPDSGTPDSSTAADSSASDGATGG